MGFEDAAGNIPPGRGTLYKLNDTSCFESLEPVLPGVSVSNGLAWNGDTTRMYYIDSPTKQIAVFNYNPVTAAICNNFFSIHIIMFFSPKVISYNYDLFKFLNSEPENALRFQDGQHTRRPGRYDDRRQR
jgi:hypothetical protein